MYYFLLYLAKYKTTIVVIITLFIAFLFLALPFFVHAADNKKPKVTIELLEKRISTLESNIEEIQEWAEGVHSDLQVLNARSFDLHKRVSRLEGGPIAKEQR